VMSCPMHRFALIQAGAHALACDDDSGGAATHLVVTSRALAQYSHEVLQTSHTTDG
jgi:hypothetical protein